MNTLAPVSTIMTTNLITVGEKDKLKEVKNLFEKHKIHHLPVVRYKEIVGIISKTDMLSFMKGTIDSNSYDRILNETRLNNYHVEEIMTKGMAKLTSTDRIDVALKVFKENLFHAIPIVDNNELVGILTTHDIITALSDKKELV